MDVPRDPDPHVGMETTPLTPRRDHARTPSPTGLYWSERGVVACARHAPYERSDTWNWERWEPLSREDAAAFAEAGCRPARCETCGLQAR